MRLEDLKGVGRVTAQRLRNAGVSVRQLAIMNPEELEELAGIDVIRASKIIRAAREAFGMRNQPITALEYERRVGEEPRLPTGVKAVDELLKGGLEPGSIYELAGEYGSGKTQLCHQLAVMVQVFDDELKGKALYIDTEGTFSPQRIKAIASRFGLNGDEALSNILVDRVITVIELEEAVRVVAPQLLEGGDVRLIVVDGVMTLYRAQFKGLEMLARRQQRLNYLLDWLKRLGRVYHPLYIIITNQVLTQPIPGMAALKVPAGGNIIAHASTHRFILRRKGDVHVIQVLDSPYLPRKAEAEFRITDGGVEDVEKS